MQVIVICNKKVGVGKSTCTALLSLAAVRDNKKVILIDLDPQKTLEKWWNKRKELTPCLADVSTENFSSKIELMEREGFDYVFIDTLGDLSNIPHEAIKFANLAIIPCKPTSTDLEAIGRTISMVKEAKKNFIFVLCQAISRSNIMFKAASILSEYGIVAPTVMINRIAYVTSMHTASCVSKFSDIAGSEIQQIWEFIKNKLNVEDKTNGQKKEKF
ncbi:ParA family protein [Rickettsia endosymbiont of Cardiosporidium cionae]|uniref:ParA family protein n=1 Tax=Rickettsia endosymbiont of Cardiosporidium cionae TaxID=2777155 RepID=UPI0018960E51|nr:ParA family protein [Rickettsia endosymbiont of Cardiosporidium cionae]KAF8818056.1 peptidyl-arginine deiminase [Rickettsia endosymbiont of Cardiosporidium cionae]